MAVMDGIHTYLQDVNAKGAVNGSLEGYMTAKALVAALRGAGAQPTRESFVQGIYKAGAFDLNGLRAGYQPGDHAGLKLVDLVVYTRDNRLRH